MMKNEMTRGPSISSSGGMERVGLAMQAGLATRRFTFREVFV